MQRLGHSDMRDLLDAADFAGLFRRLGWDNPPPILTEVPVDETELVARAVAAKRGVILWVVGCGELPARADQHRVIRTVRRHSHGDLAVFDGPTEQLWLWPEQRPSGVGFRLVDHVYRPGPGNEALLQRIGDASFTVAEEGSLNTPKVLARVRRSFNVERVTKRFYGEFKKQHTKLVDAISGIDRIEDRRWYASVLLNRLMFVYFVQRKGFLAGDTDYLRNRLRRVQKNRGGGGGGACSQFFVGFPLPLSHGGPGGPPPHLPGEPA
ncbi:MAG: hypothetical protein OXG52_01915, partial [bacterium]|nr:hypothetical protein [bacterium]